jgi:hypothetical protein
MKPISKTVWSGIALVLVASVLFWYFPQKGHNSGNAVLELSPQKSSASQSSENQRISDRMKDSSHDAHAVVQDHSASSEPAPLAAPHWAMSASGAPATAVVTLGNHSHKLIPNQLGEFQRVYLEKGGSANVQVQFPKSKPGDRVIAVMQDGGTINGDRIVGSFILDEQSGVAFSVDTTAEGGLSRVLLTCGADRKTLEFWSGDEFPLKSQVH